jgi:hypothetical protein
MSTELDEIRAFRAEDAHVDDASRAAARALLLTEIAANGRRSTGSKHPSWRPGSRAGQLKHLLGGSARAVPFAISAVVVIAVVLISLAGHRATDGSAAAGEPASAELTSMLGVLRSPQTAAARAFDQPGWPQIGSHKIILEGGNLQPDRPLIRFATTTPWGAKVFVVPLKSPTNPVIACAQEARPETVAIWVQGIGWSDYTQPPDVEGGSARTGIRVPGPGHYKSVELVPDGVAEVRALLARSFPRLGKPLNVTGTYTAVVHNNIASFEPRSGGLTLESWYDAHGHLIKHIGGDWHLYNYVHGRYILKPLSQQRYSDSPPKPLPPALMPAQCR